MIVPPGWRAGMDTGGIFQDKIPIQIPLGEDCEVTGLVKLSDLKKKTGGAYRKKHRKNKKARKSHKNPVRRYHSKKHSRR